MQNEKEGRTAPDAAVLRFILTGNRGSVREASTAADAVTALHAMAHESERSPAGEESVLNIVVKQGPQTLAAIVVAPDDGDESKAGPGWRFYRAGVIYGHGTEPDRYATVYPAVMLLRVLTAQGLAIYLMT